MSERRKKNRASTLPVVHIVDNPIYTGAEKCDPPSLWEKMLNAQITNIPLLCKNECGPLILILHIHRLDFMKHNVCKYVTVYIYILGPL